MKKSLLFLTAAMFLQFSVNAMKMTDIEETIRTEYDVIVSTKPSLRGDFEFVLSQIAKPDAVPSIKQIDSFVEILVLKSRDFEKDTVSDVRISKLNSMIKRYEPHIGICRDALSYFRGLEKKIKEDKKGTHIPQNISTYNLRLLLRSMRKEVKEDLNLVSISTRYNIVKLLIKENITRLREFAEAVRENLNKMHNNKVLKVSPEKKKNLEESFNLLIQKINRL